MMPTWATGSSETPAKAQDRKCERKGGTAVWFLICFLSQFDKKYNQQIIKQSKNVQAQIPKLQNFQFLQNGNYRTYTKYKIAF